MAKIELGSIKKDVSDFFSNTDFLKLRKRWNTDFDLWRLKPYDAGKGYYSYTSDTPRVLADKAISMMTGARLIIRVPIDILDVDEREVASNVERFLYGCFNLNDEQLVLKGFPVLRDQLSWLTALRGSYFLRVFVNKDDDGNTVAEIDAWDAYNVAYGQGKKGLRWGANTYTTTKEQILDEFGVKVPQDEVAVIDWWDEKSNAVIAGNQWAKEPTPHGLKYCPVFEIKVGSMPPTSHQHYSHTNVHRGESILAATRDLYPILNKILSDLLTLVKRGVRVPLGYWSADGTKTIDEDIWQVTQGKMVSLRADEKIEPLIAPSMPGDTAPLLQIISGELQRGGFPHTSYGELGFRLSGFAINQLQTAIESVVTPFLSAIRLGCETACLWLLNQYTSGRFKPIEVRGRTSKNEVFGLPKALPIRAADLRGDWHPEIRLEPILPKDDPQRYHLAQLARQPDAYGEPMLAMRTVRDVLLDVQDSDLEQEKINAEWAGIIPLVRLWRLYISQLRQGDFDGAQFTLMEIQRLLQGVGMLPGQGGGQRTAPTGLEQTAAGMPGAGMPTGETNLPPEVYPSEMEGGMPSGAQQARMPVVGEV